MKTGLLSLSLIAALTLSACGQKGALYLPPQPTNSTMTGLPQPATSPGPNVASPGQTLKQHNFLISS